METQAYKWMQSRRGKFTASEIFKLMTKGLDAKSLSVGAKTYVEEKLCEIIAEPLPDFMNDAMANGNMLEPRAVDAISENLQIKLKYFGNDEPMFFPYKNNAGASPDAMTEKGSTGFEIKCPLQHTHLKNLLIKDSEGLKKKHVNYWYQCHMNMISTGAKLWNFCSYNPYFYEERLHLHIIPIEYSQEVHEAIDEKLLQASAYMKDLAKKLKLEL